MVLDSLAILDAARHVHRIRLYELYCLGDILGREPAGKDHLAKRLGHNGQVPVERHSSASPQVVPVAVEEKSAYPVLHHMFETFTVFHLKGLDHTATEAEPCAKLRTFISMKLKDLYARGELDVPYLFFTFVHKDSYGHDKRGQLSDDLSRFLRSDVTRALPVEVESQRISPELRCMERIIYIGYATDFYFYHILEFRNKVTVNMEKRDKVKKHYKDSS